MAEINDIEDDFYKSFRLTVKGLIKQGVDSKELARIAYDHISNTIINLFLVLNKIDDYNATGTGYLADLFEVECENLDGLKRKYGKELFEASLNKFLKETIERACRNIEKKESDMYRVFDLKNGIYALKIAMSLDDLINEYKIKKS